jgi:hypothetical protein
MPDICEIGRLRECMEANTHEPLEVPDHAGMRDFQATMSQYDVPVGVLRCCKRCGLIYWEPPRPIEFTFIGDDD